jgi:hypothetical protein
VDAHGVGWFLDPSLLENSEFGMGVSPSLFVAMGGSPAAGRYDLLTVLLHEIGHLRDLGHSPAASDASLDHPHGFNDVEDLMGDMLAPSVPRLPSQFDAWQVQAELGTDRRGS